MRAEDTATPTPNVSGYSNLASASTLAPPDTTPPTDPSEPDRTARARPQINLSWSASTDAGRPRPVPDRALPGRRAAATSRGRDRPRQPTTFPDTSLTASTSYTYRVRAEDTATPTPNVSGYSNLASATTLAPPDTTPPTDPSEPDRAGRQLVPDQPLLERLDRRGRPRPVPDRALHGRELRQLHRDRDRPRQPDDLPEHEPHRLDLLHLPRARRGHGHAHPQRQRLLEPRLGDDAGAARHDASDRPERACSASAVSSSQINLSWSASTDAGGLSLYRIERCSGVSCGNFTRGRDRPRQPDDLPEHEPHRLDLLHLPRARRGHGHAHPQRERLLEPRVGDDAGVRRSRSTSRSRTTAPSAACPSPTRTSSPSTERPSASPSTAPTSGSPVAASMPSAGSTRDSLVFSLDSDGATLPGIAGTIDDSDVVRFDATSLGSDDERDVQHVLRRLRRRPHDLGRGRRRVRAACERDDRALSTDGSASVPGRLGRGRGPPGRSPRPHSARRRAARYAMYFDGSDVGISTIERERRRSRGRRRRSRLPVDDSATSPPPVSAEPTRTSSSSPRRRSARRRAAPSARRSTSTDRPSGWAANDIAAIDLPLGAVAARRLRERARPARGAPPASRGRPRRRRRSTRRRARGRP